MNVFSVERFVPEYVNSFEPYLPSRPDSVLCQLFQCDKLIRMNNNENAIGPSPKALEAIAKLSGKDYAVYPNGDSFFLREALGKFHNMSPERFIIGNGATELISFIIKAFCEKGDNIITADKTFAVYEWVAEFSGVQAQLVPLIANGFDAETMLQCINVRTKIIFICNPNNPTGQYWNKAQLCRFMDEVDNRAIVVVDEAYCEYAGKNNEDFPNAISMQERYPNLVVFRTFSKMFALAALRIGYLVAPDDLVNIIRRTAVCYSVNRLAQEAACGSLLDADFQITRSLQMLSESRDYLIHELTRRNIEYISGIGNYIMIKVPINDMKFYRMMMRYGVMTRTMTAFRFPNFIRVTYRTLDDMHSFMNAFDKVCQFQPYKKEDLNANC